MCTCFRTETEDVAQNLINYLFSNLDCKKKKWKKYGVQSYFPKKMEAMHAELSEKVEVATTCYSVICD